MISAMKTTLGCGLVALAMGGAGQAQGGTLAVLHSFTGGTDGATPYKGLTADGKGNFYGETFAGADQCPDSYYYANVGCGTVYKIDSTGAVTTLVTFLGQKNGASGDGNLTFLKGRLYGTAYTGGKANQGILFSVKTDGTAFKLLHVFTGTDGEHPNSFPRFDANGNMFSETPYGGTGYTGADLTGHGVLFEITAAGAYAVQHYFTGGADGGDPGRIFLDNAGNIFGAAGNGGSCSGPHAVAAGCGVLFEFVPATGAYTVLYTFQGNTDGSLPLLGGINAAGDLFGSTPAGGANQKGSLWRLKKTANGYAFSTLYSFTGGADGSTPDTAPVLVGASTLIGTTVYGPVVGSNAGFGTLFQYAGGQLTTLYTFTGGSDGGYPESTPLDVKGVIYGTTAYGGNQPCDTSLGTLISSYGCGVAFTFTP